MITLNCDLGESYGVWSMPHDDNIMAYIDMANIACGYHAGDPLAIQAAIASAAKHGVIIGAHPSYPDRQGFGRRSMQMQTDELIAMIHYQVSALAGMANIQGQAVSYIKPHGALYNDMMASVSLFENVITACAQCPGIDTVMVQSTADWPRHQQIAQAQGITLLFEVFADRRYSDNGLLVSRTLPGAVLTPDEMLEQVDTLVQSGKVITESGQALALKIDTLCVHGDTACAVEVVQKIRTRLA